MKQKKNFKELKFTRDELYFNVFELSFINCHWDHHLKKNLNV